MMNENDGGLISAATKDGKSPFGLPEKESECYGKLILVLLKILKPDFKTSDDTVLPKLLDFIRIQGNRSKSDHDVSMRILCEWLKKVCGNWTGLLDESKVFALKVGGFVAGSPTGYHRFSSTGSLTALLAHLQDQQKNSNAIDMGYLCLMESLLSNSDGSNLILQSGWIEEKLVSELTHLISSPLFVFGDLRSVANFSFGTHSGVWKNVVNMALSSSSIYCSRQSTKLLASILMAAEESTSEIILQEITKTSVPLNIGHDGSQCPSKIKEGLDFKVGSSSDIITTLNACRMIISCMMDRDHPVHQIKRLTNSCSLLDWSWKLIKNENNKRILEAANKLLCVLNSLDFYQAKDENGLIPYDVSKDIIDLLLNHFNVLVTRKLYYQMTEVCVDYQISFQKFGSTVAPEKNCDPQGKLIADVPFCIHNLLFLFQGLPILICLKARFRHCMIDILEEYIDKLFRITNSKVMRQAYQFRDAVINIGEELCLLGTVIVQKFSQICPVVQKEQGVLIFQAMIHLLEEFTAKPEDSVDVRVVRLFMMEGDELIRKHSKWLSAILNCLRCYLSKFDFSWRDTLESLCLMSCLQRLLDTSAVPPQVTVEVLKLIDLVLQKFMPPNLALLVDTIKGSSIEQLGPQLFKLLHSVDWAVRDSTLEIVKTISSMSESRFPAFQTLLIDSHLPEVVFSIIETDHESFVRTSAISCLFELAHVPNVWQATLSDKNVLEKLLLILHYETEGIVRVAAAKTITALHSQQRINSNELELVYDVMAHTAQNDLHWEVKVECLEFWRVVMFHGIVSQGMIDGVFPEVVFSKEQKKIVRLTPDEIAQRLLKTLKTLGDIGCLQVLFDTFHDDSDLAVQRKSAELIKKVTTCTKRYNVEMIASSKFIEEMSKRPPQNGDSSECYQPEGGIDMDVQANDTTPRTMDDVIEQIVSEADVDLLSGLVNKSEKDKTLPSFKRIVLSDTEFMRKMLPIDVDQVLRNREKWITDTSEGIISLLDDILLFSNKMEEMANSSDRNAIDCY